MTVSKTDRQRKTRKKWENVAKKAVGEMDTATPRSSNHPSTVAEHSPRRAAQKSVTWVSLKENKQNSLVFREMRQVAYNV